MEKETCKMILRECRFLLGEAEVIHARLGVYLDYMDNPKMVHLGKIAAGAVDTIRKGTITAERTLLQHMESVDVLTENGLKDDLRIKREVKRKEFQQLPANKKE